MLASFGLRSFLVYGFSFFPATVAEVPMWIPEGQRYGECQRIPLTPREYSILQSFFFFSVKQTYTSGPIHLQFAVLHRAHSPRVSKLLGMISGHVNKSSLMSNSCEEHVFK